MKTRPCGACKGTGKEIDPVATGAEMRALRIKLGISQLEASRRMGLCKQHVCSMEKGVRNWSQKLIESYLKALK